MAGCVRWCGVAALASAVLNAALVPSDVAAQGAGPVRVDVYIDARRNREAAKVIGDDIFPVYTYGQSRRSDGTLLIGPSSDDLLGLWKGDRELTRKSGDLWESTFQFAPVLLVLDVSNLGTTRTDIVRASLRVAESLTDRQPFIRMGGGGCGNGAVRDITLWNDGWRVADNAVLEWRFGSPAGPNSPSFRAELGQLGAVAFEPIRALSALMPAVTALRERPPRCASREQLPTCFARLRGSGQLGQLAGLLELSGDGGMYSEDLYINLAGTLSYDWKHHPSNQLRQRRQSFKASVWVFKFDVGDSVECGAPAPVDGGYRVVMLPTDQSNYQVPLPYRASLQPRGNARFELTLRAERASTHRFEVVVETADGVVSSSGPIELLYFVPTKNRSPLREMR